MILRNANNRDNKLEKQITVREFIKEIIEKDNERYLKYYRISLEANLKCRNMILYYHYGTLKSQHTTGIRMDYEDYIDHEICYTYGNGYITVDNIWNYDRDFKAEDGNKPQNIEIKSSNKKDMKEICNKTIEEYEREKEQRNKVEKVKWPHMRVGVTFEDLVECVAQMAWDMDSHRSNNSECSYGIKRLTEQNELLYSQIRWLEYKINLLQNTNDCLKLSNLKD